MNCKNCTTPTHNPSFCSSSCAAKYNNRKYPKRKKSSSWTCDSCGGEKNRSSNLCANCSREYQLFKSGVSTKTKAEIFGERTSWQSARSAIQKNARAVIDFLSNEKRCKICNYDYHVDVCHIIPVSEFDDSSLISEINNIDNLVYLCPNHHKEFDDGNIKLDDIILRGGEGGILRVS